MAFTKGKSGNVQGRTPGTQNIATKEARLILNNIVFGEFENVKESLQKVRDTDHAKYLDCVAKLLAYVIPRKTDLTSNDEPVQPITGIQIIIDDSTN